MQDKIREKEQLQTIISTNNKVDAEKLRAELAAILRTSQEVDNNKRIHDKLLLLGKHFPLNDTDPDTHELLDPINWEPIPEEYKVVTSAGHHWEIRSLLLANKNRGRELINPITNVAFHPADLAHVLEIAQRKNIPIEGENREAAFILPPNIPARFFQPRIGAMLAPPRLDPFVVIVRRLMPHLDLLPDYTLKLLIGLVLTGGFVSLTSYSLFLFERDGFPYPGTPLFTIGMTTLFGAIASLGNLPAVFQPRAQNWLPNLFQRAPAAVPRIEVIDEDNEPPRHPRMGLRANMEEID